ncbi:MAG: hypothetical protein JST84_19065 [Acidobacteria bacterium]|nr:hypothetical protein [Acidobacteriota bacterium]
MSPNIIGQSLAPIITTAPITTISDVIAVMQKLDQALGDHDGLKWFNLLYLKVTESVQNVQVNWEDPAWLVRLDVVFAQLYFDAIVAWEQNPAAASRAWRPLLQARQRPRIAPIQFALAGMNAHINHDLPLAVVKTCTEFKIKPDEQTPQHRDFQRVNPLLQKVEGEVKSFLATGLVGAIDQSLGRVDDVIAIWNIIKARDTAWNNAEVLWHLRQTSLVSKAFLGNLANLVELSSRGLLVPVL